MKTRELLVCDIRTLGAKASHLKAPELYRHIERIAASLGEPDCEAIMRSAVDSLFAGGSVPETSQQEMDRIYDAIGRHIAIDEDNLPTVLRLLALCLYYLRRRVKEAAREQRLAQRHGAHAHGGRHCEDPSCEHPDHRHTAKGKRAPETPPRAQDGHA